MSNGGISQNELDKLFGVGGGLEELEELNEEKPSIWIVKDNTTRAVCGGRCWSYSEAQNLLSAAMKDYPYNKFEIKKIQ